MRLQYGIDVFGNGLFGNGGEIEVESARMDGGEVFGQRAWTDCRPCSVEVCCESGRDEGGGIGGPV